jgi:hypothetical protein
MVNEMPYGRIIRDFFLKYMIQEFYTSNEMTNIF